ncbi:hypothetical protein HanXRQr2_Chr04g0167751 [Helianthus annuus]|uniref:Uncharacterized protein n=1 Tax=Helianthus annuus TaxID=4232 RepID=A0A9K3J9J8_HELAN|nr:hypothetical protein HanXRQr2_Chr04g0167751 [Helianthus annuus]KAJ0588987.1 hypothetical protein HanIR_Chr04g0181001 [Helianthus annuus]KAJ0931415.1 hypothetical protein HanPSC8_Chr04g0161391 [Helianthus annuus]
MGSGNGNRPAARITIEDDHCVILDVYDIDHLLQSTWPQDGG